MSTTEATSLVANTAEEKRTPTPCRSFTDDPDAPGCCAGCGDAREAHCRVCGGAGHVYDVLGHGPWDCWDCRPKRDETAKADPLSEDSLQAIICSPNFRDYEKVMARELLLSRNSFDALTERVAELEQARDARLREIYKAEAERDALTEANARQLEAITQAHKLLGALRPIDIQNATVRDSVGAAYVHLGAALKVSP